MFLFAVAAVDGFSREAGQEALICRVADGDKQALGELYAEAKGAVYALALSVLQNAQDAEDVVQETFLSVNTSAPHYRPMGKPMAWVLTIARNLSLMRIRSRKHTAELSEEAWAAIPEDAPALGDEDRLVLAATLRAVSPDEGQVVMLHAVAGFKHREIAALLAIPLSTELSRYNRALKKLKKTLEEAGFHE